MTSLMPSPELQFSDQNGAPYVGGSLAFYQPGTLTFKATWQDSGGIILNTNPIILDSSGRCIVFGNGDYRCILTDANSNLIFDQLTASTLPESSISPAMLPVTKAATTLTAMNLMGVTAAIAAAIAAVQLMPGPAGPTGPTGATGASGPAGATGGTGAAISNVAWAIGHNDTSLTIVNDGSVILLFYQVAYAFVAPGLYGVINAYLDGNLAGQISTAAPGGGASAFSGIMAFVPTAGSHTISMHLTDANGQGTGYWTVTNMALVAMTIHP